MSYTPTVWRNGQPPALNEENLNKMEEGIAAANNGSVSPARITGIEIKDGTDISPLISEAGDGGYYANGGVIYPISYANYKYFKIPVKGSEKYVFDKEFRWAFTVDSNGAPVDANNNGATYLDVSADAVEMCVTYQSVTNPITKIARGNVSTITDTEYVFSKEFEGQDMIDWTRIKGFEWGNLKPTFKLVAENKYASADAVGQAPILTTINGYNVYSVDIEPASYVFSETRFVLPLDDAGKAAAIQSQYVTSFNNEELRAKKLYLTIKTTATSNPSLATINEYVMSKGATLKTKNTYPEWINDQIVAPLDKIMQTILAGNNSMKVSGQFDQSGNFVIINKGTNLRKNSRLVFECTRSSGNGFEIGWSNSERDISAVLTHNQITISATAITYAGVSYNHGLTLGSRVQVIFEQMANATAQITLLSNGNAFKQTFNFVMSSIGYPYVKSTGLIASECSLSFTCSDIMKKYWIFGDSYVAYAADRWAYYLHEYGYDSNVLIDGFPGEGSVNGLVALRTLIEIGKPQHIIWLLGMNDGTDTNDTTPSTDWATYRDQMLEICKANNIDVILGTIPNVPSINHKAKNAWIKSSGYRYVDMCHAVGADVSTSWYPGMQESDNVHPTEAGARALFTQMLLDVPEIMINNL